ncbi:MAG TPA: serine/threonine-protein kinase [Fimbriiglobus sp.]|jgi:serine/threonine protein kinase
MPRELPSPTARTIGSYELIEKIAEGGMGAVFKARNRTSGQIVAIKIIPAETARNLTLLKRFEQEFKAARLLNHPNVVKALDYSGSGPTPFLVMEFVDGESLGQRVERDGAIPEEEAVSYISQVCDGLHRAHKQGLIHRDVKPDNILVTADGVAKLTDLGLVKEVEGEQNLTRTGRGLGTPHFMAPEQFRDAKNADVKCDVYSLGATLYMILTGQVPFQNTSPLDCWMKKRNNEFPPPREVVETISKRVDWAVRRAMSSDPATRPATCREFMEDLSGHAWRTSSPTDTIFPYGAGPTPETDLWYLAYRDADGKQRTVKGSTESVRKNFLDGALGEETAIIVSRLKSGPFNQLKSVPEFRDLVIVPGVVGNAPSGKSGPPTTTPTPNAARGQTVRLAETSTRSKAGDPNAEIPTEPYRVVPVVAKKKASSVLMPSPELPVLATLVRKEEPAPLVWPWVVAVVVFLAAVVGFVFVWTR